MYCSTSNTQSGLLLRIPCSLYHHHHHHHHHLNPVPNSPASKLPCSSLLPPSSIPSAPDFVSAKGLLFPRCNVFWIRCPIVCQRVMALPSTEGEDKDKIDSNVIPERTPFVTCHDLRCGDWIISSGTKGGSSSKRCIEQYHRLFMISVKVLIGMIAFVLFVSTRTWGTPKNFFNHIQVACGDLARITLGSSTSLCQFGAVTSALQNRQFLFPSLQIPQLFTRISYVMDVTLERNPTSYILFLISTCSIIICIGGLLFSKIRNYNESIVDSFWDAWACVSSSSTHLKFSTGVERAIGFILAVGGLFFYSLLISTMTAQFKSRMEWFREGAHSEVMENGHIVICGVNNHLITVLRQLNKSHEIARRDGLQWPRKQTVLLLSEHERKVTENMVSYAVKDLSQLNIHTRSGSLSNTVSFEKVAAGNARSIIILASIGNKYEADAESVLTVLALQPLLEDKPGKLVVEVLDLNTLGLLKSSTRLKANPLQNLSSKILVQCSRQPGLIDVYRELLEHDKQVINLRAYPNLKGISYQQVRTGFPKAVVCGLIREGKAYFHPQDSLRLEENDKLMLISAKNEYKHTPSAVVASRNFTKDNCTQSCKLPAVLVNSSVLSDAKKRIMKAADWRAGPRERILILGWHFRVAEMIMEFDDYVGPGSELIVVAETPVEERERILNRKKDKQLQNIRVIHQVGNPMSRTDLASALLNPPRTAIDLEGKSEQHAYITKMPHSVLVISDIWKMEDRSRPDKKAVLALLLAEATCKQLGIEVVSLVAEFINMELGRQVMNLHPNLTAVGTDEIVGLVTSQVAEEPELNNIWTELLNSWGNEIYMKDIRRYIELEERISFAELSERAIHKDEVAIGFRMGGKTVINPCSKDEPLSFTVGDSLVVICEFEYS